MQNLTMTKTLKCEVTQQFLEYFQLIDLEGLEIFLCSFSFI